MSEPNRYGEGKQDAWIEAIRENVREQVSTINARLDKLSNKVDCVAGKVNHIYGGALALGAVAGAIVTAIALFSWGR